MIRSVRKFVAIILAIWMPLFSGNVLAVSVVMQAVGGDCHPVVTQQDKQHLYHATTTQHAQSASNQDQSADLQDKQDSACENSGICHLACCGYMAIASIKVAETQPVAQSFTSSSIQFQSIALTPLDPPPLARA
jgi:hypothetical protein